MRRGKKHRVNRIGYTYIEDAARQKLHEHTIPVDWDDARKVWWVNYPYTMKWESGGRGRMGVQLYDDSTLVTVTTPGGLRLYVTRPTDPLYRPSFDEQFAAKE